jgi:hypothetical protein
MNKKVVSTLTLILIIFVLGLTGCGTDSSLKGASIDKTYTKAEVNTFVSITKGFAGDDFDYTKENTNSYNHWLSYMTNNLKQYMKSTIPARIKADKASETVENFEKIQINSVIKLSKNKKNYAVVNFDVYQNMKHNKDISINGKEIKTNGDIYLIKVGNTYKVDAFDYGNATVVK